MIFNASDVQLSSRGGDYFQIHLSESKAKDHKYILLQNSFEFFRGPAYFECHDLDLAGQGRIKRCELRPDSLEIDVADSPEHITVTFNETNKMVGNMAWILRIILDENIPFVNISEVAEIPMDDEEDAEYF